jgi:hypothetical protein
MAQPVKYQPIGAQPQPAGNIQTANPNNAPVVGETYRKIGIITPFSPPGCVNEIYLKKPDATATILDIKIAAAEKFSLSIESIILLFSGDSFKDDKPILELDLSEIVPRLILKSSVNPVVENTKIIPDSQKAENSTAMAQLVKYQQIGTQPQPTGNAQAANPNIAPIGGEKFRKIRIKFSGVSRGLPEIYLKKPDATAKVLDIKIAAAEAFNVPIQSAILVYAGARLDDATPISKIPNLDDFVPQFIVRNNQ